MVYPVRVRTRVVSMEWLSMVIIGYSPKLFPRLFPRFTTDKNEE